MPNCKPISVGRPGDVRYTAPSHHPTTPTLTIFDLQVALILPTKFPVNWPFGSEEEVQNRFSRGHSVQKKRKIYFQDGGHLGFPISMILAIFEEELVVC